VSNVTVQMLTSVPLCNCHNLFHAVYKKLKVALQSAAEDKVSPGESAKKGGATGDKKGRPTRKAGAAAAAAAKAAAAAAEAALEAQVTHTRTHNSLLSLPCALALALLHISFSRPLVPSLSLSRVCARVRFVCVCLCARES